MTLAAPFATSQAAAGLAGAAAAVRAVGAVLIGAGDLAMVAEVLALGLPTTVVDAHPGRLAAARDAVGQGGAAAARSRWLASPAPRTLADLRCQLPSPGLFVFDGRGVATERLGEALFWLPRGEGALVLLLDDPAVLADLHDQLLRWSPDHTTRPCTTADGAPAILVLPRPRVHVTFLIEKYTGEYGRSGLSINLDNLVATLDQTGYATWNVVHYDECFHEGRPLPMAEICKPAGCDEHVLACVLHYHSRANPTAAQLLQAKVSGSRVVYLWLDKKISKSTPEYYAVADVNVVFDGNDFELPNSWPVWTPKNPQFFHDPGLLRDLDVSLVGEVRYLSQRKAMVDRLRTETRIPVTLCPTSAADTGRALSIAEYARLYQRSKISIAMTKDSSRQLKGRVFEIVHCGALLFCDRNHHVSHYLRPGTDYVVYDGYEDLVHKARYFLEHEDERRAIARSGHLRVKTFCSHDLFWRSLLARVGASAAAYHAGAVPLERP